MKNCFGCHNKFNHKDQRQKYCSKTCFLNYKRSANTNICKTCSKSFFSYNTRRRNQRFCSRPCFTSWHSMENNGNWKGSTISKGYVLTSIGRRNRILEHRLVMEIALGRKLNSNEHVHHINGDRSDNRIENLEVLENRQHKIEHNGGTWIGTRCKRCDRKLGHGMSRGLCRSCYNHLWESKKIGTFPTLKEAISKPSVS